MIEGSLQEAVGFLVGSMVAAFSLRCSSPAFAHGAPLAGPAALPFSPGFLDPAFDDPSPFLGPEPAGPFGLAGSVAAGPLGGPHGGPVPLIADGYHRPAPYVPPPAPYAPPPGIIMF